MLGLIDPFAAIDFYRRSGSFFFLPIRLFSNGTDDDFQLFPLDENKSKSTPRPRQPRRTTPSSSNPTPPSPPPPTPPPPPRIPGGNKGSGKSKSGCSFWWYVILLAAFYFYKKMKTDKPVKPNYDTVEKNQWQSRFHEYKRNKRMIPKRYIKDAEKIIEFESGQSASDSIILIDLPSVSASEPARRLYFLAKDTRVKKGDMSTRLRENTAIGNGYDIEKKLRGPGSNMEQMVDVILEGEQVLLRLKEISYVEQKGYRVIHNSLDDFEKRETDMLYMPPFVYKKWLSGSDPGKLTLADVPKKDIIRFSSTPPQTEKKSARKLDSVQRPRIIDTVERPGIIDTIYRLKNGRDLMGAGKYAQAIKIFDEYIQKNPTRYEGYRCRADAYFMSKNHIQAITNYTLSLYYNPRDVDALLNKAISHYELRGYALSILDLEKALKIDPRNAEVHFYLGLSKMKSGKGDKGCAAFFKAFQLGYEDARDYLCNNE